MLCFPIFYEKNWNVYMDGVEQDIININGGLIGVRVLPGEHNIKLKYENKYLNYGAITSVVAWIIYLSIICCNIIRKRRKERDKTIVY